jgi:hypothetical protein
MLIPYPGTCTTTYTIWYGCIVPLPGYGIYLRTRYGFYIPHTIVCFVPTRGTVNPLVVSSYPLVVFTYAGRARVPPHGNFFIAARLRSARSSLASTPPWKSNVRMPSHPSVTAQHVDRTDWTDPGIGA